MAHPPRLNDDKPVIWTVSVTRMFAQGSIASQGSVSFQNRAGSTVAIQQTKLNVFQYQRQAVFQCGLLGVNAFGCGKITLDTTNKYLLRHQLRFVALVLQY